MTRVAMPYAAVHENSKFSGLHAPATILIRGFPDAVERKAKLPLAYALNQVLEERALSQADAAKVLRVAQPEVSALRSYKLAGFTVERLMNLLTRLDSSPILTTAQA